MCTGSGMGVGTAGMGAPQQLSLRGELTAQKLFASFMMSGAVLGPFHTLPHSILAAGSHSFDIIPALKKNFFLIFIFETGVGGAEREGDTESEAGSSL